MGQSRRGFTLLEMMLVLALILIIGALSYPSMESAYSGYKLTCAADQVRAAWAKARERSLTDGIAYQFAFVPNTGNLRVAPDTPEYWPGGGTSSNLPTDVDPDNPPLVLEDSLPKGFYFLSVDSAGGGGSTGSNSAGASSTGGNDAVPASQQGGSGPWVKLVLFRAGGTPQADAAIRVQGPSGRPLVLKLRALTGFVTVQPFQASENLP